MGSIDATEHADLAPLRLRGRRAYEQARLRLGVRAGLLALPLTALSLLFAEAPSMSLSAGALLAATVGFLRFSGNELERAIVPGLLAGSPPLLLPMLLRKSAWCCVGGMCAPLCLAACIAGGMLAGAAIGLLSAREAQRRSAFVFAAGTVATLTGTLGCAAGGVSGMAAMLVALLATSGPVAAIARGAR